MPTDNPMDMIRVQADRDGWPIGLDCLREGCDWNAEWQNADYDWPALGALIRMAEAHVREAHPDVSRETSRVDVSTFDQAPGTAYLPGRDVSRETCADEWQPAHGAGTRPGECATCWDGRPASDAGA